MENTGKNNNTKSSPLLQAKGISHNFDYPLFDNIDFNLEERETIAIIGISGSGKSTLLNIFSSLLIPNKGEVYYNNKNLFKLNQKQLLDIRRKDFGIIFQSHYLFRGFTAQENLHITELLTNQQVDQSMIDSLGIDHVMKQGIGELSGGQQQRLSCARVLTKKPKVIFADEPTGNLDTKTAQDLIDVLFDYVKENNAGLIIVTHENDIAQKCDKIFRLYENRLERIK